jgi:hypothetical protein
MAGNYDAACAAATTAQGLDPVVARLKGEGFDVAVEQTGGFCMVATVQTFSRTYAIISDGQDPERPFCVGTFTTDAWRNGGKALRGDEFDLSLDEVAQRLTAARAKGQSVHGARR